jgi:protein MpaA
MRVAPPATSGADRVQGSRCRVIGHSVEGRPIEAEVHGSGPDTVLILASIHGNEPAGTPLLHALADHLDRRPQLLRGRTIILVPVVNPDGYEHNARHNANRVDLNRNFPADNRKDRRRYGMSALSEPESVAIFDLIDRHRPSRIISLHQFAACIDYDGPGRNLAEAIADAAGLDLERLGGRPGSLGSFAGEQLGIPVITVELPSGLKRKSPQELFERFGKMLVQALIWPARMPRDVASGAAAGTTRHADQLRQSGR